MVFKYQTISVVDIWDFPIGIKTAPKHISE